MTTKPESNAPAMPVTALTEPMPVLPLRDVVVYPHMVIPLFVGREKSILALEQAMKVDKQVLLLAQKQADVDEPAAKDLYDVGTIATILQLLKLPDGTVKVLVEVSSAPPSASCSRPIISSPSPRRSPMASATTSARWTCSCAPSSRSSSST